MGANPVTEARYRDARRKYIEFMNSVQSFVDATKQTLSMRVGVGYGYRVKEIKFGLAKAGFGVLVGAGGIGLDSENISSWGESTADIRFSFGDSGGRFYLWDISLGSSNTNRVHMSPGYDSPT